MRPPLTDDGMIVMLLLGCFAAFIFACLVWTYVLAPVWAGWRGSREGHVA